MTTPRRTVILVASDTYGDDATARAALNQAWAALGPYRPVYRHTAGPLPDIIGAWASQYRVTPIRYLPADSGKRTDFDAHNRMMAAGGILCVALRTPGLAEPIVTHGINAAKRCAIPVREYMAATAQPLAPPPNVRPPACCRCNITGCATDGCEPTCHACLGACPPACPTPPEDIHAWLAYGRRL